MSLSTDALGIADADLVTSGGRGHLVQFDGSSNERLDLVTTSRSTTIAGALTNNDADTAADKAKFVYSGWVDGIAGTALEPGDLVQAETDSEFGLYVAGKGHTVVGQYLPELRAGGTNLPDAAAGDKVRIYLFANKTTRRDGDGCLKAVWDFAVDGGAISTIGSGVFFPDNAVVYESAIDVITTCTSSGDAGTMALTSTNITIDAAIAISAATAQVDTLTPLAVNDAAYWITIIMDTDANAAGGGKAEVYNAVYVADASATVAEITAGLTVAVNNVMPASTVLAADGTTELTLTAEVAGKGFYASSGGGASGATITHANTTANVPDIQWDAGLRRGDHFGELATTWQKTSSEQELNFVIATEAFTAGKIVVFANYWISE
jgi:hypothetical protein